MPSDSRTASDRYRVAHFCQQDAVSAPLCSSARWAHNTDPAVQSRMQDSISVSLRRRTSSRNGAKRMAESRSIFMLRHPIRAAGRASFSEVWCMMTV